MVSPGDRVNGCRGCFFMRGMVRAVRVEGCAATYSDLKC